MSATYTARILQKRTVMLFVDCSTFDKPSVCSGSLTYENQVLQAFMMFTILLNAVQTWAPIRLGGMGNAAHPSSAIVFKLSTISNCRTKP
jgi:hypothetical protein